jgi:alkylhydroperoxidase family enzyme
MTRRSILGEVQGQADLDGLRKQGLTDADILRLNLVVSYFNFVNRIALGLGVEFTLEEITGHKY